MPKLPYTFKQTLFYLFLLLYLLLLAQALFFKEVSPLALFDAERSLRRGLNLVPFRTIAAYGSFNIWIALMNLVGNVVLFLPMGLYVQSFRRRKSLLPCVALVCAVSFCVEVLQYALGLGSADIDDLILNTLGGLLGALFYRLLYLWCKDEAKTRNAVTALMALAFGGALLLYLIFTLGLGYRIRVF